MLSPPVSQETLTHLSRSQKNGASLCFSLTLLAELLVAFLYRTAGSNTLSAAVIEGRSHRLQVHPLHLPHTCWGGGRARPPHLPGVHLGLTPKCSLNASCSSLNGALWFPLPFP